MNTFTVTHNNRKHQLCLVSLYPDGDARADYYVCCGAYAPAASDSDRMEWQHKGVRGTIPIPEMIRWAIRRGFLTWQED